MDFRMIFSRDKMIQRLKDAAIIPTVVMDEVFAQRPQLPSAFVPVEEVTMVVRSMPVTRRGAASIAMPSPGLAVNGYEPLPININIPISAADLLTLKHYDSHGLEAWARAKTETLRRTIRHTTEGLAAQALSGKIDWEVQLDGGGTEKYTVEWGSPVAVTGIKKFDAADATLTDVVKTATNMRNALKRKGFGGGQVKVWAGEDAFYALMALAENYDGKAHKVEIKDSVITVAGTDFVLRSEEYPHPTQKKTFVPIMAKTALRMIDVAGGGHRMPYCALDDLDANLAPLPMFINPIKTQDPSGYKLVAMSKPFPVPNMEAIAEATVVG